MATDFWKCWVVSVVELGLVMVRMFWRGRAPEQLSGGLMVPCGYDKLERFMDSVRLRLCVYGEDW